MYTIATRMASLLHINIFSVEPRSGAPAGGENLEVSGTKIENSMNMDKTFDLESEDNTDRKDLQMGLETPKFTEEEDQPEEEDDGGEFGDVSYDADVDQDEIEKSPQVGDDPFSL